MSNSVLEQVWPLQMKPTPKAVLIALADRAQGPENVCWPSIRDIRMRTCYSERAVRNALRWLEQNNYIKTKPRNGSSTYYYITPAQDAAPAGNAPRQEVPGREEAGAGVPGTGCPSPRHEVPPEPKENHQRTQMEPLSKDAGASADADSDVIREIFDHWLTVMEKDPEKTKLTQGRRKKIRARLRDYPKEDLLKAIDGCRRSPFHMGANDAGKEHNDIELICRNGEKLEQFRDMPTEPPKSERQKIEEAIDNGVSSWAEGLDDNDPFAIDFAWPGSSDREEAGTVIEHEARTTDE